MTTKRSYIMLIAILLALPAGLFAGGSSEEEASAAAADVGFNAQGHPIVDQQVTFEIATMIKSAVHKRPFAEMPTVQRMEELTNVHVEWIEIDSSEFAPKMNLMFASNDLPDIFLRGISKLDQIKYADQGLIQPLDELIDAYAPNILRQFDLHQDLRPFLTTPDGNIYSLPAIWEWPFANPKDRFFINKRWLDAVNMDVPETTEEFHAVLRAFKDEDPNGNGRADEIPFTFTFTNDGFGREYRNFFSLFGSFGILDNEKHLLLDEAGEEVILTAVQPEYREAIDYLHVLYSEGLMDQEGFTQDHKQMAAKGASDPRIVGSFFDWTLDNMIGAEAAGTDEFIAIAPLEGPDGHRMNMWYQNVYKEGFFTVTHECEHPEVAIRWIDTAWNPNLNHLHLELFRGPIGVTMTVNDEGMYEELPTPEEYASWAAFSHSNAPGTVFPANVSIQDVTGKYVMSPLLQRAIEHGKLAQPYLAQERVYPDLYFTPGQIDELASLETTIRSYIDRKQADWIINGNMDDEWDEYIEQLGKMGIEEMMAIYQEAYETYVANQQ